MVNIIQAMSTFVRYLFLSFISLYLIGCTANSEKLTKAEQLMEQYPDSALKLLKSMDPSQLIHSSEEALYSLLLSQAYDRNEIYITSDSIITIATQYYGKENPNRAGNAWLYSSRCAKNRGNAEVQAEHLLKAQEFAEQSTDYKLRALIYCDKADMYKLQQQNDSCIVLNKKGLQEFIKANDKYNVCLTAITLGLAYTTVDNPDSCIKYLLYAESIAMQINANELFSPIYKGLGNCEIDLNNYPKALEYYKKAPKTGNPVYDENQLYLISNIYSLMDKTDSAEYFIQKIKCPESMNVAYYHLRKKICDKQQNLEQSLYYANKLLVAKDSFYTKSLQTSFAGLQRKFTYNKLNDQNNKLKIESANKTAIILIISLVVSIGIIAFMYWSLRIYKRELKMERQLNDVKKDLLEKATENNELLERQLEIERQLKENEKDLLQKATENYKLLRMQNDLQQQLLLFIEQYRLGAGKGNINIQASMDDENIRKQIILYVDCKYNNISQRLYKEHLDLKLNERDVFVCCMLLAEFTSGMIAVILNLQLSSVNILRSRLRKKLKIENNEKLTEALSKL